jgi:hypothetical protein
MYAKGTKTIIMRLLSGFDCSCGAQHTLSCIAEAQHHQQVES